MTLARLALSSLVALVATAAAAGDGGEASTSVGPFSPSSMRTAANQSTTPAIAMPEAKRAPDAATAWSPPSPSDLAPMTMHHRLAMPPAAAPMSQPQAVYSPAAASNSPPPQQHFAPANHQLADDEFPGNQYGPSNEYRSEHYGSYPPFEQPQQGYPLLQQQALPQQQQQQQLDTSLVPTAKHFVLVSFIGLLLLFSIIQNSITAARRKDALVEVLSNRKKRDVVALANLNNATPELRAALKEDARVRCIQRTLCYETRKLRQDLGGVFGNLLGRYLTRHVSRSLQESSPGWDRLVRDAANAGSRGDDCDIIYRDCSSSGSQQNPFTDPTEVDE